MARTVLITGASGGVGAAAAQYFLSKGWNVAATARSLSKLGSWVNSSQVAEAPPRRDRYFLDRSGDGGGKLTLQVHQCPHQ